MNAKPLHTLRTYCLQYSKQFGPGGLRPYSPSAFARPSKQKRLGSKPWILCRPNAKNCSLHLFDGLAHDKVNERLGLSDTMVKQNTQHGNIVCAKRRRLMGKPIRVTLHPRKQ